MLALGYDWADEAKYAGHGWHTTRDPPVAAALAIVVAGCEAAMPSVRTSENLPRLVFDERPVP